MAIPSARVNVNEVSLAGQNVSVPFLPAILLKTKSGPIGTVERVNSVSEFITKFGQPDATTPAAKAVEKYLQLYQYAYITRIANENSAKVGTSTISFKEEGKDDSIELIKIQTLYDTDLENGKSVKLVVDTTNNKIYMNLTEIMGRNMTTIKEDIDISTVKAAERDEDGNLTGGLEFILDKLVASANSITNMPLVFTNAFKDKMDTDTVPSVTQFTEGFTGYIENGDSGNSVAVSNLDVMDLIDLYNYQDYPIHEMVIPEYRAYEVVNYAVQKGREQFYRVIGQATGKTVNEMITSVQDYAPDNRGTLEIYANDVTYEDFVDANGNPIECPISVAVLNAYAFSNFTQNAWCAIAGTKRGVLTQINGLAVKMTKQEMDDLYDNVVPINTINYISSIGYVVWGNKTSALEVDTKIFDRVNVSRLIQYMTRELTQVGWEYLFEPINLTLFAEFKAALEGICQIIEDQDGIEDYVVVCNSSNNTDDTIAKNELHAEIQVKPTEALEYIIINLTGTDTITISVDEIEEEV